MPRPVHAVPTGRLVPLLQIAACKTDAASLLVVSPDLAEVLSGAQYAWSNFTYQFQAPPRSDGHVATLTFRSPKSGYALVTAEFQVRVHNDGTDDCHIESQLATAPAIIGVVQPTQGSAGYVDEWMNASLPTEVGGSPYLGQNMPVSRVFQGRRRDQ